MKSQFRPKKKPTYFTMKSIRQIVLSAFLTISVFSAILYGSCTKDACKQTTCLNTGTCKGGICTCPTGIGGASCETVFRQVYAGTYSGNAIFGTAQVINNTVTLTDPGNTLTFTPGNDTVNFNTMSVEWQGHLRASVNFAILLTNNSSTGSTFMINATTIDTNTYQGTGSVNGTIASLNLVETHPHSPALTITLSSFTKQ